MPACEVCSSEQSKYRCPTCGLMSCSLSCTQSHKIYCAPKPQSPSSTPNTSNEPQNDATKPAADENGATTPKAFDIKTLASSTELKDLFAQYPQLRDRLQDIYKATLEEQWVEEQQPNIRGRFSGRGRGGPRSRGPWTREKGYNRGLGKVRKFRERCEEGLETGKDAEGFMRFMDLLTGENQQETA